MYDKNIMLAKKLITEEEKEIFRKFKNTIEDLSKRVYGQEPVELDDEIDILYIKDNIFNNINELL